MNTTRLTFYDPTNITLPITVFDTLVNDAYYFGFIKNKLANISGLLNHLIPNLSDYRDDLHNTFLENNDGNEELTNKIEENIYKYYFNKYDYCDDGVITVPFRVNKEYYEDFLIIHDVKLQKYNMNFTNYIRSLLIEYTSKRIGQREYFFFYRMIGIIKNAIENNEECRFYTEKEILTFIPISIELSRITSRNLIIGVTADKDTAIIFELVSLKKVFPTEKIVEITQEDCDFIYDILNKYYETKETQKCSD